MRVYKYQPRDNAAKYELFTTPEEKLYTQQVTDNYFSCEVQDELPF
ncbi:MAG: hypothetical protein PHU62_06885 [Bacteroidales bacterium]|jgi:hypothetical protein|nr:hypothetical protein [Bacteroidales bacterium]MDD2205475.1 hypothetical protein [Bacteroidales bacterium]MDD3914450.1 hypothetical protein [Bacteroidales bacterium]MDD4634278.1 hypothetical protein [Bacteroidales bacterium]